MGQHSTSTEGQQRRVPPPVIVLSLLLVLAVGGWLGYDYLSTRLSTSECESPTTLSMAASPDIAPALLQAARSVPPDEESGCYRVDVSIRDSSATAQSLSLSDGTPRPDVWVPDSTQWLRRAQDTGAWNVPVSGTSVGMSPVVIALSEDIAQRFGWPDRTPTWGDIFGAQGQSLNLGFPDPAVQPVGVAALLTMRQLIGAGPNTASANVEAMRRLSRNTMTSTTDLFARLPGGTAGGEALNAFPTSENAVLRHNIRPSGTKVVAIYPDTNTPTLDYPFVILPDTPEPRRAAAEKFLAYLLGNSARNALADAGFRGPDGQPLRNRAQDQRTTGQALPPIRLPEVEEVDHVLNEWAGANRSGRILTVLDISGSMNGTVPGTGRTRLDITLQAAEVGISLFKPTTDVGLWAFSTRLDGNKDYKEIVPIGPVRENLEARVARMRALRAVAGGGTGLYDTVLAAYKDSRQSWTPGRINVVVLLTDGRDDDNGQGVNRGQLLDELAKAQDPRKPLPIIGIGIGPDIDLCELNEITEATGGKAYAAPDPTKIGDVFFSALSTMLCQPPSCD